MVPVFLSFGFFLFFFLTILWLYKIPWDLLFSLQGALVPLLEKNNWVLCVLMATLVLTASRMSQWIELRNTYNLFQILCPYRLLQNNE